MVTLIMTAEVFGFCILLIMLCGSLFEHPRKDRKTRTFNLCVVLGMLALAVDLFCYGFDGRQDLNGLLWITNHAVLLFGPLTSMCFSYYLLALINERKWITYRFAIPSLAVNSAAILLILLGGILGKVYIVRDATYTAAGIWYSFGAISVALSLLYYVYLILRYRRTLGTHDTLAMFLYLILPVTGAILEMFIPELGIGLAVTAMSLLIVYIMLQSGRISELNLREKLLQELSQTDTLTGSLNRRAFNRFIESVSENGEIGVVFCDLNRLKYTNDTDGHNAGDALLIRFVQLMKQHFPEEHIYRISGDEFVSVCLKASRADFDKRVSGMKQVILDADEIAALGSSYGPSSEFSRLLHDAEQVMYLVKEDFHRRFPQYDRK